MRVFIVALALLALIGWALLPGAPQSKLALDELTELQKPGVIVEFKNDGPEVAELVAARLVGPRYLKAGQTVRLSFHDGLYQAEAMR